MKNEEKPSRRAGWKRSPGKQSREADLEAQRERDRNEESLRAAMATQ